MKANTSKMKSLCMKQKFDRFSMSSWSMIRQLTEACSEEKFKFEAMHYDYLV